MDSLETLDRTSAGGEAHISGPTHVACLRDDLAAAAATVQRAVSSRTTIPILSGVLIETTAEGLRFVGTDLELSVETFLEVMATGHAAMVLPARYFGDIVRRLPEREVTIEFDAAKRVATIASGKAVYSINSMDATEFPLFPQVEGNVWWRVQGKDLAEFVRQTAFAAAADENRPSLTGVLMSFGPNEARLAATDTFRLAQRRVVFDEAPGTSSTAGAGQMIVPARALNEVGRIVQNESGEVEIFASQNQVAFKCRKTTIVSRLIDGQFPNYDRVIPKAWKTRMVVERLKLLDAVERVAVLGKDEFGTVKLGYGGETLAVSANAPEVGMAFEEVPLVAVEGERGETALRARFLLDALRAVGDEEISVEVTGAVSPVVLKQAGNESSNYLYLIMPVTVNS